MAKVTCPICGDVVDKPADGICPSCGISMDAFAAPAASTASTPGASGAAGSECPVCQATVPPGAQVCDDCGVNLADARAMMGGAGSSGAASSTAYATSSGPQAHAHTPAQAAGAIDTCPSCGAGRRPGASFCRECGEPFPIPTRGTEELLRPGEFLSNRYRIERKLGGGGMGAVYLARDINLKGKLIAIKAVLNSNDPDMLRAARQEAENLLNIDHPNIVTLRDIVEKQGIPLIVMDYLEGPDWNNLFEQRLATHNQAFTAEEGLKLILGILPAFEYLHGRRPPVVYRDFKPGQVKMVKDKATGEQRHVLLDLGVAYAYEAKEIEAWGTVGYAPPEIGGVCHQPPAMDLATLCRTLEGLVGIDLEQYPYGQMPEPQEVPWIPEELYYLLERGTALDPRRRFQKISELRAQLDGVLRLIQGREGTLPAPTGTFYTPVISPIFTGHMQRTTGQLIALPIPRDDDPAAPLLERTSDLLLQGKPDEALQQAEMALQVNQNSTNALLLKTVALAQMDRLEEAERELQKVSKLTDISSDWSYGIVAAQIAENAGDVHKAEQLYRDVLRIVPGELPPRQKLANLMLRGQRYSEAADLYQQIVRADPANAEAILNWADALAATGNNQQAISELRRVGQNAVRFVDAQIRMIELLLQRSAREPDALNLAAEAITSLQGRAQSPRYYRLTGDWWFEAYQLARNNKLKQIKKWPLVNQQQDKKGIAQRARDAYRHYLRVAPNTPYADEIIGRIHFGIREMM
ncbi:MAG: protein kinase domain-containing protein [Ardenticatenaceae bacterium]